MNGRRAGAGSEMRLAVPLFAAALVVGAAHAQTPEPPPLARTYGGAVHAYFSGDFDRCYEDLTATIEAGSEDPRTRYFRGLAALRLGRLDEAEADFSSGADLESRALGSWPVSRSLERVQGHDRLRLERHRMRARVAAVEHDRAAAVKRYSDIEFGQPDVLRRRRPAGADTVPRDDTNPFTERGAPDDGRTAPPAAGRAEPIPEPIEPVAPTDAPAPEEPAPEAAEPAPAEETPAAAAEDSGVPVPPEALAEPSDPADAAFPAGDEPRGSPAAPAAEAGQ